MIRRALQVDDQLIMILRAVTTEVVLTVKRRKGIMIVEVMTMVMAMTTKIMKTVIRRVLQTRTGWWWV